MSIFRFEVKTPKKKVKRPKKYVQENVLISEGLVVMTLPVMTVSEANTMEHWTKHKKRHDAQQKQIMIAMINLRNQHKCFIPLPCTITCVRLAPGTLEAHDNLPMAFKAIVDQLADEILPGLPPGKADADPRFTFKYNQVKSKEYGIQISICF